ncbi:DUF2884 family protein [Rhodanobacter sp. Col0626]|uniref:DUF2884 family protein n=1 Tax=Rhodanobacter sp. Col0626 TaxID=3415679 RepID=UPI003CEE62AF
MSGQRLILALAIAALVAGCGDGSSHVNIISPGYTSIAGGRITLSSDEVTLHGADAPEAKINAGGDLHIGGNSVAINAAQREQLQHYYLNAIAVREHGIATGKAGTAVAGAALKDAASGVASGDAHKVSEQVSAKAKLVKLAALKICHDMAGIKSAQDNLAAQLPAFKPYAGILDASSIDDCRSEDSE